MKKFALILILLNFGCVGLQPTLEDDLDLAAKVGGAQKITALTADTAPTSDDLVVSVNDPSGTPRNRKVTLSDLFAAGNSGINAMTVALATDDTWSGLAYTANAGAAISQWELVFLDPNDANNEWQKADADLAGDFPAWGFATSAGTDGNALVVMFKGCFRNDAWQATYTDGALLYLDDTTVGGITATAPSTSTDCVQPVARVRDNGVTAIFCIDVDPVAGWATVP